jgi:hypothetical protein
VNYRSQKLLGLEFKLTTASTHSERNILVGLYCERTKDGLLGCQYPAAPDSVKTSPVATHENVWSLLAEAGSLNSNAKRGEEICHTTDQTVEAGPRLRFRVLHGFDLLGKASVSAQGLPPSESP